MPERSRRPRRVSPNTLASIAAELGVSRTTVSNAYNRPDQLSEELRERIFAAARKRGYSGPDPTARSLRTRRAGAVGVILTEALHFAFEDEASVDFLAGLARQTRLCLTLIPVGPEEANPALVTGAIVDGFIVYSVPAKDPHLKAAYERGLPVVVCDQPTGEPGAHFVGIDDAAAITKAARVLIDAGHRHIGILTKRLFSTPRNGPVNRPELADADLHVQRARVRGALDVFDAAGVGDVPIVTRHLNDRDSAAGGAGELLTAHPELTAVLCTTDSMALGVLDYCAAAGIDVPGELSVTGFDATAAARAAGLTTVEQPNVGKGEAAGAMLRSLIESRDPRREAPREVILPTRLIAGRTVSAPRQGARAPRQVPRRP
ncbi:LacI family DNA-binding transcriptional regulator [Corynebacterium liangguodongii]|uniref:LacI family transcriptional regulator n=1 Tax=Corynebacterium liangguodongii TaxID=2079535 RepID=A0A2S0WFS7_9CORY|nr:LacI family DNA-binding transcriptional regulator [Corynebacterium liangguodongii]AWB84637.1 LacI family transcriptional regulator [Corynebacterium liangguodongii]PWB99645.1 LacI family DNA-binding transcriptional regulator [Corynebacterium liangguodongii]